LRHLEPTFPSAVFAQQPCSSFALEGY